MYKDIYEICQVIRSLEGNCIGKMARSIFADSYTYIILLTGGKMWQLSSISLRLTGTMYSKQNQY